MSFGDWLFVVWLVGIPIAAAIGLVVELCELPLEQRRPLATCVLATAWPLLALAGLLVLAGERNR